MIGILLLVTVSVSVTSARWPRDDKTLPDSLPPLPPGSRDVCPHVNCRRRDRRIPKYCNKPEFVIGRDGQTRCRVCDSNFCGKRRDVCPQIDCRERIPRSCRIKQYVIGTDGITKCRVCDKDGCLAFGAAFKAKN